MVRDESVQAELDEEMTLRALGDLDKQGTSESYLIHHSSQSPSSQKLSLSKLNESFQNVAMDR